MIWTNEVASKSFPVSVATSDRLGKVGKTAIPDNQNLQTLLPWEARHGSRPQQPIGNTQGQRENQRGSHTVAYECNLL